MKALPCRSILTVIPLLVAALLTACGSNSTPSTALPASPTARSIIKPTDRPTVTPLASPTPTLPPASPTPTPDTRLIDFTAPDVNPFTGEKVADPAVLNRRPLAIKIGDSWEAGVTAPRGGGFPGRGARSSA